MIVIGFWNEKGAIVLKRKNEIIAYEKRSLEYCIGRGDPIYLEMSDQIQDSFDEKFMPKRVEIPLNIQKRFDRKDRFSVSRNNFRPVN